MGYPRNEYLVESDWLAGQLDDPDLRIIDCGVDFALDDEGQFVFTPARTAWEAGHIPGASFVDFNRDVSDPSAGLPFMLPPPEDFSHAMQRCGVSPGTRVIIYDKFCNNWAARLWWILRAYGFTEAAVLNGGRVKWEREGRPLSTDTTPHPRGSFVATPDQEVFVGRDEVLAAIDDASVTLVDALDADHYSGAQPVGVARRGHIPTAANVSWTDVVDMETHTYRSAERLREILKDAGVTADDRVLNYCTAGVASSLVGLAMALMGHEDVSIYDGSLLDWAADPALPMETAI